MSSNPLVRSTSQMQLAVRTESKESAPLSVAAGTRYILTLWLRHWPQALLLVGVLAIYESYKTFFSLSLRALLDTLQTSGRVPNWSTILGWLLLVFVVAFGARLLGERVIAGVGVKIQNELRNRMFRHLQRLPQSYYSRTPMGEILARFSSDLAAIERGTTTQLRDGLLDILELLLNLPVLFYLDWRLATVVLIFVVLLGSGIRLLAPHASAAGYAHRGSEALSVNLVQENVRAQAIIRAFGFETLMQERFGSKLAIIDGAGTRALFLRALVSLLAKALLALSRIAVAGVGVLLVMQGTMTIGDLVAFLGLAEIVSMAVDDLSRNVLPDLITATSGIQRIEELLQQPTEGSDSAHAVALPPLARRLELAHVSFSYSGQQETLRDLSLTIEAGQSVAFVGPSGSGKSTLLSLLIRAHTATTGRITFDGIDLKAATRASLQQQMGVVFQETYLFNTTIRENIRMAKPHASDAEVEAAARQAEIHDLILQLPQQYETPVGEAGGSLSGGQRQRIAIARAILRNPALLILDEATSALDPGTEAALNQTLQTLARGRTVVTVTHRLSSVVTADRIFVMERGRLAESGSHGELLARQGLYAHLWQKQTSFEISADGRMATVRPEYLRQMALFAGLTEATLAHLTERFSVENVPAHQFIFRQGDPGDKLYLIARGQVEVLVRPMQGSTKGNVQDGNPVAERCIDTMGDGDHFGEMALLQDVPRNASIRTRTNTLLLTLPKVAFLALLSELPPLQAVIDSQIERTLRNRERNQVG